VTTLFISDLHLIADRPQLTDKFIHFLEGEARRSRALYILGDLFEIWSGDDVGIPLYHPVISALATLTSSGVPVYFMRGNRDFLVGKVFAQASGCQLLNDPTVIDLDGTPTALFHGDLLCTDDVSYQRFRRVINNRLLQWLFLKVPADQRRRFVEGTRTRLAGSVKEKSLMIMDVNQRTVQQAFIQLGVQRIIHGHTHRPAIHDQSCNGKSLQRIVLGDWYEQGSLLRCEGDSFELSHF